MARKFDSEILITPEDKWIFRGNEITQEDILKYFRKNLKQDDSGVYIDNRFGELEEHGYLNLQGYPVHITSVSEEGNNLVFHTDSDKSIPLKDIHIQIQKDGTLEAYEKGLEKIRYRFSKSASTQISNYIQENPNDGNYLLVFQDKKIPIPQS